MLRRLAINADAETLRIVAGRSGLECVPLDGARLGPGTAAVIVRPRGDRGADGALRALREASFGGVPVLVVAGSRDGIGAALLSEAERCGVPPECVLLVEGGRVVDAAGNAVADALRGVGIGVGAVVRAAERAVREGLVPEPCLWEAGGPPEEAVWAPEGEEARAERGPEPPGAAPERAERGPEPSGGAPPVEAFLEAAGAVAAVFGVKSGVGATTVAACLAGVLADADALHLEASASPSGYLYYGPTPAEAARTGRYACVGGAAAGAPRPCGVLVADVSLREAADAAFARAGCVIVVADGSPAAFERVGRWVWGGWRLDVLAVNRALPGAGYPPEAYQGEYGLQRVFGIPGGFEEEAAVNLAQQKHALPFGRSVDFDGAVGELARAVREILEARRVAG